MRASLKSPSCLTEAVAGRSSDLDVTLAYLELTLVWNPYGASPMASTCDRALFRTIHASICTITRLLVVLLTGP